MDDISRMVLRLDGLPGVDLAKLEAEARAAAARPDPVAQHRDALGEVVARLDELANVRLTRLTPAKRNRLAFGLDNARREIRRALAAGPARG